MSTLEIPTGFTSEQIQKLASGPYTEEDSMASLKLGFAQGLCELGILPSEFERMFKEAEDMPILGPMVNTSAKLMGLGLAGGALLGGYSGLLRHRAEKAIDGKNDPDITAQQNSLKAYREMIADLRRNVAITQA
jgi:hypothetical protein